MKKIFSHPQLLWTDSNCSLEEKYYKDLPLLVDVFGTIVTVASDWFRSLRLSGKIRPSSVEQYAYALASFWSFLHMLNISWTAVSDSTLRLWRNNLHEAQDGTVLSEKPTINDKLRVVFRFYDWAQTNNYVSGIIGVKTPESGPYPIAMRLVSSNKREYLTSDILYRETRKPQNPIPNSDEMEQAMVYLASASNPDVAARNCLVMNWVSASGVRRAELLSLTKDHLPSKNEAIEAQESDLLCFISIVGKGGHIRVIPVAPEVIIETWDYINGDRASLITRKRLIKDHGHIFVSHNTGGPLNPQHLSRIISAAFKSTGRAGRTLHRVRARFTSLLVQSLRKEEEGRVGLAGLREETILARAAEILGHKDLGSLRYYLNLDLDSAQRRKAS